MTRNWLDPREALGAVNELIAELTPEQLAQRLAGLVRRTPDERLDAVLSTPARRVILDAIFWQIPHHLDRRRAAGVNASIRWRITGRADGEVDVYDLVIAEGGARVTRGGGEPVPRMTITVDAGEFLRIAAGSSSPLNAYFSGKLAIRGDLMQAARLTMLFRVPSPDRPRESGSREPRS